MIFKNTDDPIICNFKRRTKLFAINHSHQSSILLMLVVSYSYLCLNFHKFCWLWDVICRGVHGSELWKTLPISLNRSRLRIWRIAMNVGFISAFLVLEPLKNFGLRTEYRYIRTVLHLLRIMYLEHRGWLIHFLILCNYITSSWNL